MEDSVNETGDVQREDAAWEGYAERECGEHRTTGGRAWCFSCSEWCYEGIPCKGCELPLLRALLGDIVKQANGILHTYRRWSERGAAKDAERLDDWTALMERAAVFGRSES